MKSNALPRFIGSQFRNPKGLIGKICGLILNLMNQSLYNKVVHTISLSSSSIVLDIGYGNGYFIHQLFKTFKPTIYGIDLSDSMLLAATNRNKKGIAQGRIHLSIADCCHLPFPDNTFHAITTINTIYFWDNVQQGLSEIYRTLQPNGLFYNVIYTKEWLQQLVFTQTGFSFYDLEQYVKLGKQVGFTQIEIVEIDPCKSYMLIYRK